MASRRRVAKEGERSRAEPRKRAKRAEQTGSEPEGTQSVAEAAATAAWWKHSRKSRQTLVREYVMLLLIERKNLRFKDYLYQCVLEEKLAELLFDPDEDEAARSDKLQLLHTYNALLDGAVHAEPASPAHTVEGGAIGAGAALGDVVPQRAQSAGSDACAETLSSASETGTVGADAILT